MRRRRRRLLLVLFFKRIFEPTSQSLFARKLGSSNYLIPRINCQITPHRFFFDNRKKFCSDVFIDVRDLFIQAAQLSPIDPDPDVQCGLGVIFNLASEYEKATDCFQVSFSNLSATWSSGTARR